MHHPAADRPSVSSARPHVRGRGLHRLAATAVLAAAPVASASGGGLGEADPGPSGSPDDPRPRAAISVTGERGPRRDRPGGDPAPLLLATGPEIVLPPLDLASLAAEDAAARGTAAPPRIGVARGLPDGVLGPGHDGAWTAPAAPGDPWAWTLTVVSPGAVGLRLHASLLDLPPDGRLLVGRAGAPAAEVHRGLGPRDAGTFWTSTVPGDRITLRYEGPRPADALGLVLDEVMHVYRDPVAVAAVAGGDEREDAAAGAVILPCHEDVQCQPHDEIARDAVGTMSWIDGGTQRVCTGVLLADLDPNTFAGWFLTANHCLNSQAEADTLEVYWFWQSNQCDGGSGLLSNRPKSFGATLVATSPLADHTLLRLANDPDDGQGFAGWTTESPESGQVVCIHHPEQAPKKISVGVLTSTPPTCADRPFSEYWYADWEIGVTESGSSGAPLFNDRWQVIGQLFGHCFFTPPACDNPADWNAIFGRFDRTYPAIEESLTSITPDDAYEENDDLSVAARLVPGTYDLRLVDFRDVFRLDLATPGELAVTCTLDPAEMDVWLFLRRADGSLVAGSISGGAVESFVRTLDAGTYFVDVRKVAGWGGDYELEIVADLEPPGCPSDFDGDGRTGFLDLVVILEAWGPCPGCATDLNGDDLTGFLDLVAVLEAWGDCP